MSGFESREKALEAKFEHDQLVDFKITARRNRLLGLWVAEQLNKTGAEAESYARQLVELATTMPAIQDLLHHIKQDFMQAGIDITDHRLMRQLELCHKSAVQQITQE
ncbi:MAG: DUF1476 domain-containing protein [Holosporales bacterium]